LSIIAGKVSLFDRGAWKKDKVLLKAGFGALADDRFQMTDIRG